MVAQREYTSIQGPTAPVSAYCSMGLKPFFTTSTEVGLWPSAAVCPESTTFAAPRSSSHTSPSRSIMMLSGLMSRWMRPRSWALDRASITGRRVS